MKYQILQAQDPSKLSAMVEEAMKRKMEPTGGVAVQTSGQFVTLYQAMVERPARKAV